MGSGFGSGSVLGVELGGLYRARGVITREARPAEGAAQLEQQVEHRLAPLGEERRHAALLAHQLLVPQHLRLWG